MYVVHLNFQPLQSQVVLWKVEFLIVTQSDTMFYQVHTCYLYSQGFQAL